MKAFVFFLFCSVTSFAQSSPKFISGKVKDNRNEVIPGATVRLLNVIDSTMIKGEIADGKGEFKFNNLPDGVYILAITAVGQKKYLSIPLSVDEHHRQIVLPAIVMSAAQNTGLQEVVVRVKRPLIEQEPDKTIVNVESMISSATSNTLEVLEKTPGISIGSNGEISLNGRGAVLVLIDGRPTYMSGQDLAAYLKSLPGGLLDKIELMDNPPARYDASGNAIINIRLKKNRTGGLTGNISSGYSQGRYARNNEVINLNYNHKKLNIFGNIGYNLEKNYTTETYFRRFYQENNELSSKVTLLNNQLYQNGGQSVYLGLDYAATPNTTYGFLFNLNKNSKDGRLDYFSKSSTTDNRPDVIGTGNTIGMDKRTNLGINLNFLHKFKNQGKELSADINYLNYQSKGNQTLQNFVYQPEGTLTGNNEFLYLLPSTINIFTVKADYVHSLKNNAKWEAGFKSSLVNNDNISDYYLVAETGLISDNSRSNHFKYDENINAAYFNTQKSWKRLSAQFGLRIENTRATGQQLGNEMVQSSSFNKDYTQLFPGAFISYKLDTLNKNTLTLGITRRIGRPNYQQLNPFLFFIDKYSYSSGNPLLNPQYQYRFEIKYQHKQFLRMGLSYNKFSDLIFQTMQTVNDIFINSPNNLGFGYMLLLSNNLSFSPAKWWYVNTDIMLSRMGLDGTSYSATLNPSAWVARINVINQFRFEKGWSAEFGGYYASIDLNGQAFTEPRYRLNATIQKKIWKEKGSIRLGIDDMFHSWIQKNSSVGLKQADFLLTNENDTQRIGLAFTYRFGKETFARKRRHNNNASDAEKERVE
ncbi:Outer membrane receptor proteins, mostly Fe transport [Pseudarcicella hirudinis]|uniref:Outer membrane receptor proteins, mostly Fe transport n=1 Tax=Pseudarcicella hirudinis TaxID=1079859 RepID=A0A1I5YY47_9BACT|nr:outer membrane beta-barrel family protein [Pseudarcicella hirudinis]SFQ49040.1 Outer membrane receptor proteins, mostly Fe transport [Pseudarcicella hirudinis]